MLLALERSAETAYDDLCRQLAFRAASDDVSFDVVVLAYSLITYTTISRLQQTGVLAVGRELAREELPLVVEEVLRVHAVDDGEREHAAVGLEEAAAHEEEGEALDSGCQDVDPSLVQEATKDFDVPLASCAEGERPSRGEGGPSRGLRRGLGDPRASALRPW